VLVLCRLLDRFGTPTFGTHRGRDVIVRWDLPFDTIPYMSDAQLDYDLAALTRLAKRDPFMRELCAVYQPASIQRGFLFARAVGASTDRVYIPSVFDIYAMDCETFEIDSRFYDVMPMEFAEMDLDLFDAVGRERVRVVRPWQKPVVVVPSVRDFVDLDAAVVTIEGAEYDVHEVARAPEVQRDIVMRAFCGKSSLKTTRRDPAVDLRAFERSQQLLPGQSTNVYTHGSITNFLLLFTFGPCDKPLFNNAYPQGLPLLPEKKSSYGPFSGFRAREKPPLEFRCGDKKLHSIVVGEYAISYLPGDATFVHHLGDDGEMRQVDVVYRASDWVLFRAGGLGDASVSRPAATRVPAGTLVHVYDSWAHPGHTATIEYDREFERYYVVTQSCAPIGSVVLSAFARKPIGFVIASVHGIAWIELLVANTTAGSSFLFSRIA